MNCVSCEAILSLQQGIKVVYVYLWEIQTPIVLTAITAFFVIQLLFDVLQLMKGDGDGTAFVYKYFINGTIASVALAMLLTPAILWDDIFSIFLNFGPYVGIQLLENFSDVKSTRSDFIGLLEIIEFSFFAQIQSFASRMFSSVSIWDDFLFAASSIILVLPYIYFIFIVIKHVIGPLVDIYVSAFFAPFWIGALVFESTRQIFAMVLRILFTAGLQLISITAAVGIVLAAMSGVFIELSDGNSRLPELQEDSQSWLSFLILGFVMSFVVQRAVALPSLILNTFVPGSGGAEGAKGAISEVASTVATGGLALKAAAAKTMLKGAAK